MYSGAWLFFAIVVFIISYKLHRTAFRADLSALPGPPISRFSRFWLLQSASSGSLHQDAIAVHEKYGCIVRVGPNHVWVNDAQEIERIYGIASPFRKSRFYTVLGLGKGATTHTDLFTCRDPEVHRAKKRKVANAYAMSSMLALEPLVDECVDVMFEHLEALQEETEAGLDLGKWLQWYAFDVVGAITFSKRFGFMEEGKDISGMIKGLETSLVYTAIVGQVPELHPYLKANRIWGQYLRRSSSIAIIAPFTQKQIVNRSKTSNRSSVHSRDFLSRLHELRKEHPDRVDDYEIFTFCMSNLLAGSDTTAISLRSILYYLIRTPSAYRALQQEIDQLDQLGALSSVITFAQSLNMPYLQASMKEALRLHPGVGFPLERLVPANGATVCGKHLNEDTIVGMNAWALHRNHEVFGDDAEAYRPERWIEADENRLKAMEQSFFTFGHGPRACIGKNISILEMSKVVPQLLRYYDFELAGGRDAEWKIHNYWFARQTDLVVRMTRRDRRRIADGRAK